MPARDFYFCYDPNQTTNEVQLIITNKSYYDQNTACSDWELYNDVMQCFYDAGEDLSILMPFPEDWDEYFMESWDEVTEGSFSFFGSIEVAVGILRRVGFIEKQNLLVPFGGVTYTSLGDEVCEQAFINFLNGEHSQDIETLNEDEDDIEGALTRAVEAELDNINGNEPSNVFSVQSGITPNMSTADILAVARQRMADSRREYEQKITSEPVNVDITKVSRYDSDWDKTVIFKGFNFRVVLRDEESVIRRMNLLREVEKKISTFLSDNDYIVQTNNDTDELEVYLKSTRAIVVWKMEDAPFFSSMVERIEQHEG
jgi:translation initiation factor 2 beta subunit (eIF-2beta)/eIF-5